MATEFLQGAMEKIYCFQYYDGLTFLQKAELHAMEAIHLSSDFEYMLKSIQIKLISLTLLETAVELEGNLSLQIYHKFLYYHLFKAIYIFYQYIVYQRENNRTLLECLKRDFKK